jgi:chitin synthase
MGLYQDGLNQSAVNKDPVHGHLYEFTAQTCLDEKFSVWGPEAGIKPLQIIFCLKEKNAKKINSHRWFFNGFL